KTLINASIYEIVEAGLRSDDDFKNMHIKFIRMDSSDVQTIKVQFRALGLMVQSERNRSVKDKGTYWTLTPYGENLMTTLRAIKR
ncbi:hypothetical protein FSE01_15760, partial [Salmonella enterica subsp. enterica]|nr:hypothetical protein [Salmonella enterica subsp. enterica serovar Veneziana]